MVNLNGREVNQPPAIKHHSDSEIEVIQKYPLKLNHPCHNQHVERHATGHRGIFSSVWH